MELVTLCDLSKLAILHETLQKVLDVSCQTEEEIIKKEEGVLREITAADCKQMESLERIAFNSFVTSFDRFNELPELDKETLIKQYRTSMMALNRLLEGSKYERECSEKKLVVRRRFYTKMKLKPHEETSENSVAREEIHKKRVDSVWEVVNGVIEANVTSEEIAALHLMLFWESSSDPSETSLSKSGQKILKERQKAITMSLEKYHESKGINANRKEVIKKLKISIGTLVHQITDDFRLGNRKTFESSFINSIDFGLDETFSKRSDDENLPVVALPVAPAAPDFSHVTLFGRKVNTARLGTFLSGIAIVVGAVSTFASVDKDHVTTEFVILFVFSLVVGILMAVLPFAPHAILCLRRFVGDWFG
uniref:NR LBD domain-containing protein n=1 Tax=Caenorhabditis tropicalis TaxID=1561998 RepID=A0A1I7UD13_9PELO